MWETDELGEFFMVKGVLEFTVEEVQVSWAIELVVAVIEVAAERWVFGKRNLDTIARPPKRHGKGASMEKSDLNAMNDIRPIDQTKQLYAGKLALQLQWTITMEHRVSRVIIRMDLEIMMTWSMLTKIYPVEKSLGSVPSQSSRLATDMLLTTVTSRALATS